MGSTSSRQKPAPSGGKRTAERRSGSQTRAAGRSAAASRAARRQREKEKRIRIGLLAGCGAVAVLVLAFLAVRALWKPRQAVDVARMNPAEAASAPLPTPEAAEAAPEEVPSAPEAAPEGSPAEATPEEEAAPREESPEQPEEAPEQSEESPEQPEEASAALAEAPSEPEEEPAAALGGLTVFDLPAANTPAPEAVSGEGASPTPAPEADAGESASPTPAPEVDAGEGESPAPIPEAAALEDMPLAPDEARRVFREMGEIAETALPTSGRYGYEQRIVANGKTVSEYQREAPFAMNAGDEYAQVDGVLTFRGNNYRDGGAFGVIPDDASGLSVIWTKGIGAIDDWTGVGWTGQASIVRWPQETRRIMNLNDEKKGKDGLKEVIYGTLDGNIYFLDLDDGQETRASIRVPSSIKGSVSVDPRGYPLLYCGQGIPEVNGNAVKIGTRIFSLIDQQVLFFLNGRDDYCLRHWYAFDCSPLICASNDTMLQLGENGIAYTITLNTNYDPKAGTVSVDPVVDRMVYKSKVSTRPGMENSPCVYDHYAYYTDNSGLLTCLDLNTMEAVWLGYVGDDSDSSIVLEEDDEGVWLYTVCELDLNGLEGDVYCRRFNALTGEEVWKIPVACSRYDDSVDAGGFATPALGKGSLSDLVFFNVCHTRGGSGRIAGVDKKTGEVVWSRSTGSYSWSSPVCAYDSQGRGYVIFGNSGGILRLCDGRTGEELAQVDLEANIEGTPAIFDDTLVVGTRGSRIYGVKITN